MKTVKYTKPSGMDIEVNDTEANREYAKLNGWKKENKSKSSAKKEEDGPKQLDKLI